MKKRCIAFFSTLIVLSLMVTPMALAHEFIVKPVTMSPHIGVPLPFSVVSAHIFMVSEEMEPADQVSVLLARGKDKKNIPLVKNPTLMTLDGSMSLEEEGTYLLCGHRKGIIWTQTTQGWKQAGKKGLNNVISSGKYEKFCKTLINVGTPDNEYKRIVGHALEIVPMDDPAALSPGDECRFQILFKGKPLSSKVYATYDGFSSRPNTYAYMTETDENGVAYIKLHHEGCWMVRVENKIEQPTDDYNTLVIRSVLVFDLK